MNDLEIKQVETISPSSGFADAPKDALKTLEKQVAKVLTEHWAPGNSDAMKVHVDHLYVLATQAKAALRPTQANKKMIEQLDHTIGAVDTYKNAVKDYRTALRERDEARAKSNGQKSPKLSRFDRVNGAAPEEKSSPVNDALTKKLAAAGSLKSALENFTTEMSLLDKFLALCYEILDYFKQALYDNKAQLPRRLATALNEANAHLQDANGEQMRKTGELIREFESLLKKFPEDSEAHEVVKTTLRQLRQIKTKAPSKEVEQSPGLPPVDPKKQEFLQLLGEDATEKLFILMFERMPVERDRATLARLPKDFLAGTVFVPRFEAKKNLLIQMGQDPSLENRLEAQIKELEGARETAEVNLAKMGAAIKLNKKMAETKKGLVDQNDREQIIAADTVLDRKLVREGLVKGTIGQDEWKKLNDQFLLISRELSEAVDLRAWLRHLKK